MKWSYDRNTVVMVVANHLHMSSYHNMDWDWALGMAQTPEALVEGVEQERPGGIHAGTGPGKDHGKGSAPRTPTTPPGPPPPALWQQAKGPGQDHGPGLGAHG